MRVWKWLLYLNHDVFLLHIKLLILPLYINVRAYNIGMIITKVVIMISEQ